MQQLVWSSTFPDTPISPPLPTSLHSLPFMARIKFKTLVLTFQAVKGSAPAYLQKIIRHYTLHTTPGILQPLQDAWCLPLSVLPLPVTTTVCSGSTMVERPPCRGQNSRAFKCRLKTHLFNLHLSPPLPVIPN